MIYYSRSNHVKDNRQTHTFLTNKNALISINKAIKAWNFVPSSVTLQHYVRHQLNRIFLPFWGKEDSFPRFDGSFFFVRSSITCLCVSLGLWFVSSSFIGMALSVCLQLLFLHLFFLDLQSHSFNWFLIINILRLPISGKGTFVQKS